jgi:hypothetical protein
MNFIFPLTATTNLTLVIIGCDAYIIINQETSFVELSFKAFTWIFDNIGQDSAVAAGNSIYVYLEARADAVGPKDSPWSAMEILQIEENRTVKLCSEILCDIDNLLQTLKYLVLIATKADKENNNTAVWTGIVNFKYLHLKIKISRNNLILYDCGCKYSANLTETMLLQLIIFDSMIEKPVSFLNEHIYCVCDLDSAEKCMIGLYAENRYFNSTPKLLCLQEHDWAFILNCCKLAIEIK